MWINLMKNFILYLFLGSLEAQSPNYWIWASENLKRWVWQNTKHLQNICKEKHGLTDLSQSSHFSLTKEAMLQKTYIYII